MFGIFPFYLKFNNYKFKFKNKPWTMIVFIQFVGGQPFTFH